MSHVVTLVKHVIWEENDIVFVVPETEYKGNYEDVLVVNVDISSPVYLRSKEGFYTDIQRMWYMGDTPRYVQR